MFKLFAWIIVGFVFTSAVPASAECPIKQDLDVLRYMDADELLVEHINALEITKDYQSKCIISGALQCLFAMQEHTRGTLLLYNG